MSRTNGTTFNVLAYGQWGSFSSLGFGRLSPGSPTTGSTDFSAFVEGSELPQFGIVNLSEPISRAPSTDGRVTGDTT